MKNKFRYILWLAVITLVVITLLIFKKTYALFENNAYGIVNNTIGQWVIRLSNQLISSGVNEEIEINNFVYASSSTVETGYIAPGTSAYFDLIFDATDCDVAVKYDIDFKMDDIDYADNIRFTIQELNGGQSIRTAENTYSGVITLSQIANDTLVTLRVSVVWDNVAAHDADDTELGTVENNKLTMPINVRAVQYLGEQIIEYQEQG